MVVVTWGDYLNEETKEKKLVKFESLSSVNDIP